MKTYKATVMVNLPLAIIPLFLIIPLLETGSGNKASTVGFLILSAAALLIFLIPFGLRLKVQKGEIETSIFGISLSKVTSSEVAEVRRANILRGGLGVGKGLRIKTKLDKTITIGEKLYGKEAIDHAEKMLVE